MLVEYGRSVEAALAATLPPFMNSGSNSELIAGDPNLDVVFKHPSTQERFKGAMIQQKSVGRTYLTEGML